MKTSTPKTKTVAKASLAVSKSTKTAAKSSSASVKSASKPTVKHVDSVRVKKTISAPVAHAVGRRKSSIARAWLRSGKGGFMVNGKEVANYFPTEVSLAAAVAPCAVLPEIFRSFDIEVNVRGGGICSQADAVKLSIARAVNSLRDDVRPLLKGEGLLRVDSRVKERKKYGQKGARRKFQFVKR